MNYITYADKEKTLELNSIYIINADDANEIKLVVNNIVDWWRENGSSVENMFRYVKINIPSTVDSYKDLTFEASDRRDFTHDVRRLKLSESNDKFSIFENGRYASIPYLIGQEHRGKSVIVDVTSIISDERVFCRFKLGNDTYRTFVLGMNDYSNRKMEVPIPVVLVDEEIEEKLESLKSCGKNDAAMVYNRRREHKTSSENLELRMKAYLKYDRVPGNVIEYAENNPEIKVLNETLVDVTDSASFSILDSAESPRMLPRDEYEFFKSISASVTVDTDVISFSRSLHIIKEKPLEYYLKNPNAILSSANESYELDVRVDVEEGDKGKTTSSFIRVRLW